MSAPMGVGVGVGVAVDVVVGVVVGVAVAVGLGVEVGVGVGVGVGVIIEVNTNAISQDASPGGSSMYCPLLKELPGLGLVGSKILHASSRWKCSRVFHPQG